MIAVKCVSDIGCIDATCPIHLWPDKSIFWRKGFSEGWYFAHTQPMSTPIPLYTGDHGAGFSFGLGQFAMINGRIDKAKESA